MHRTDTERDMRELVRKGQEESLTTPTILDVREKGAAGAQSDGAGKGMQAGKPVLIGEGRMLQSPACPVGIAGMGGWIPWMSKKGWLQRRQGVQGLATAKETWREAGIARSSCSSGRCGGSHPEPFMSEEQRRTMAATPRKVGKALGCDSCPFTAGGGPGYAPWLPRPQLCCSGQGCKLGQLAVALMALPVLPSAAQPRGELSSGSACCGRNPTSWKGWLRGCGNPPSPSGIACAGRVLHQITFLRYDLNGRTCTRMHTYNWCAIVYIMNWYGVNMVAFVSFWKLN